MADEPEVPMTLKVNLTPIQQRIRAVNEDGTLSTALHGEINRSFSAQQRAINFNSETLQLLLDALEAQGIITGRLTDLENKQVAADREQSLLNSYTSPTAILSRTIVGGTSATVTIADHTRIYPFANSNTTVSVTGGVITGLDLNTNYFFFYDDPTREGGAVTFQYSTNNIDAAQTGNRHSLGYLFTGSDTAPPSGGGVNPPGGGGYYPPDYVEP